MKNNPDDRGDNVERIQDNLDNTIRNMELADEMMAKTDNSKTRQDLEDKNQRRRESLDSMKKELRDESNARRNRKA